MPPYMNPESAAAQRQAVALGALRRNRCTRPRQEIVGRSSAAAIMAASNMHASGRINKAWKMRHQDVPCCTSLGPN